MFNGFPHIALIDSLRPGNGALAHAEIMRINPVALFFRQRGKGFIKLFPVIKLLYKITGIFWSKAAISLSMPPA